MSSRNHQLDPEHELDRVLMNLALDRLAEARGAREQPVPLDPEPDLPARLPEHGLGAAAALERLAPLALAGSAQLHHPGYFAHMDPPTACVTWAAALWQVACNQNLLHPDAGPGARALERRVVEWLAPAFAMDGGHLVPGSTVSNFTALWAARELRGIRRVVASERAHLSVRKAADILGLDYQSVTSDTAHRIRLADVADLGDAALVLTAGTVATGAIDPLERRDAAWLHVDAAWAGPLRLTRRFRDRLAGIERADSVGFSAHKWLYQPKGCALVLFKDSAPAHEAMSYGGGYLAAPNIGFLGSAPATALPLAASLLAWGADGVAERIEADMDRAQRLVDLIDAEPRFERWGPAATGVVVWRPIGQPAAEVRDRLRDAWVSLTDIDGETWLRCVATNASANPEHVVRQVLAAM